MKKLILSVLAIAAMTSCTKSSVEDLDPNAPVEIKLNAGIEVNTISKSVGAITPQSAVDDVIFVRADETTIPSNWTIATVQSIDAKIAATTGLLAHWRRLPAFGFRHHLHWLGHTHQSGRRRLHLLFPDSLVCDGDSHYAGGHLHQL